MRTTPAPITDQARGMSAIALLLGLASILGALAFEHIGGLYPCVLCLTQRWPYYLGLPLIAIALAGWRRFPGQITLALLAAAAALFAWGTMVAFYHTGVEWDIFEGPTSCSGVGEGFGFDALASLDSARIVACDAVQWEMFGISLAGFNFIISAIIATLLTRAALAVFKTLRTPA